MLVESSRPAIGEGSAPDGRQVKALAVSPTAQDQAGASARREYERRHQLRERRIEQKWGHLSGVVKFLSDDPQSTRAWATGSEGERRLAACLARAAGDKTMLLHDRKAPRTGGNIDHLAIAPSGVWVVDAKHYKGLVEHRDVGGWLRSDYRLFVGGRDRSQLATGLDWQVAAVRAALDGTAVPITAALCFIDAEWRPFSKPFRYGGVWVTWGSKLAEMIAAPGPLTTSEVAELTTQLATSLPAATPSV